MSDSTKTYKTMLEMCVGFGVSPLNMSLPQTDPISAWQSATNLGLELSPISKEEARALAETWPFTFREIYEGFSPPIDEQKTDSPWRDMATAPKDGEQILILFDSATVDIVRLCFWRDGNNWEGGFDAEDVGWWSYKHSVTQEQINLDWMIPIGWMPFPDRPDK